MPTDNLNNARILIVDDEPTNLKLVDRMLRGQGYTNLVLIQDPREVVDRFSEAPTDLILLDINMPNIDGFEVMKQLKALQRPLMPPIIILTAQSGRDILLRSLAEGARDFISKPFDRIELIMRVRNLLEAHQAHRLLHDQKAMLQDMVRNRTEELRATRLHRPHIAGHEPLEHALGVAAADPVLVQGRGVEHRGGVARAGGPLGEVPHASR